MAVSVYNRADMESLARELHDLSFSLLFNDRPSMRDNIRKGALVMSALLSHSNVDRITIECNRRERH